MAFSTTTIRGRSVRLALLGSVAALVSTPSLAQEQPHGAAVATPVAEDAQQATDIVVTAQKRSQRIQDVPMAISAISGDKLVAAGANTLQDVINRSPGVQLVSNGPASNEVVIRGLSVGAGINSSVATYIDETPFVAVGPYSGSSTLAPNADTYDLARVEVLRGPQGTLYGASAMGGLLKYVTNAPDPSRVAASFLGGVGNTAGAGRAGWEAHAMVNLPLASNLALRVVGEETYFPGFIDDPARGARDINAVRRYSARASLLWKPTPDLSIRLNAQYQHLFGGDNNTVDVDAVTLRPAYGDLQQRRQVAQTQTIANQVYNGVVDWDMGFANLVSSTSYIKSSPVNVLDITAFYADDLTARFGGDRGAAARTQVPMHGWTQELRLSSAPGHALDWIAGFYFNDATANQFQRIEMVDTATHTLDYDFTPRLATFLIDSTYREIAGFGGVTYHVTPKFEVAAGGRYSTNKQGFHQMSSGVLLNEGTFVTNSRQSVFTYSVDGKYRFDRNMMAYGRIASGFVPGGPNAVLPGSSLSPSFKSSRTTNYELGIKGSAAQGRFSYDLDIFNVDWDDIQLTAVVNGFYGITNGGKARSRGVEGGLSVEATTGLTIDVNGAYTDARITETAPESLGGVPGARLPLSPRWAGSIGANYEHPLRGDASVFGGAAWHYNGARLSPFDAVAPRVTLPAYSVVDLRVGLKLKAYTLTAYVKNVGNLRGLTTIDISGIAGAGRSSANITMPRTIGMTLAAKF